MQQAALEFGYIGLQHTTEALLTYASITKGGQASRPAGETKSPLAQVINCNMSHLLVVNM